MLSGMHPGLQELGGPPAVQHAGLHGFHICLFFKWGGEGRIEAVMKFKQ